MRVSFPLMVCVVPTGAAVSRDRRGAQLALHHLLPAGDRAGHLGDRDGHLPAGLRGRAAVLVGPPDEARGAAGGGLRFREAHALLGQRPPFCLPDRRR